MNCGMLGMIVHMVIDVQPRAPRSNVPRESGISFSILQDAQAKKVSVNLILPYNGSAFSMGLTNIGHVPVVSCLCSFITTRHKGLHSTRNRSTFPDESLKCSASLSVCFDG